jgi:hypothetical protein
MVVSRRDADGTEDAGFGNQVIDVAGTLDEPGALALQPDGRLVVAGVTSALPGGDVAVGRLRLDRRGAEAALDAVVLPDGRIVLAGQGGRGSRRSWRCA